MTLFAAKTGAVPTRADFLGITVLLNSTIYCCNSCGGSVQWLVGEVIVATNRNTDGVGSVDYQTNQHDSTALSYASVILAEHYNDSEVCMDVVLIITNFQANLVNNPLRVICIGTRDAATVVYPTSISDPRPVENGTVNLELSVNEAGVVLSGSNSITQIIACYSNETRQIWLKDDRFVFGYNGVHFAGNHEFQLHPNDTRIAIEVGILLSKRPREISSILILTSLNYSVPFRVTCASISHLATTVVQKPPTIFSTELVTSNSDLTFIVTDSVMAGSFRMVSSILLMITFSLTSFFSA